MSCTNGRAGVRRLETEVRFENLSVSASVLTGQQARQTLLNYYKNGITVRCSILSWQNVSVNLLAYKTTHQMNIVCDMTWRACLLLNYILFQQQMTVCEAGWSGKVRVVA